MMGKCLYRGTTGIAECIAWTNAEWKSGDEDASNEVAKHMEKTTSTAQHLNA